MRRSPLRLVQKRWKAAYVTLFVLVTFGLAFSTLQSSELFRTVVLNLFTVAGVYFGTRIFRGANELLLPPRAWWRMTARPKAGFLLGAYSMLGIAMFVLDAENNHATWPVDALVYALLTVFYGRSSILLLRAERRTVVAADS